MATEWIIMNKIAVCDLLISLFYDTLSTSMLKTVIWQDTQITEGEGLTILILWHFGNLKSTYSGNFGGAEVPIHTLAVPEFKTCTPAPIYRQSPIFSLVTKTHFS